MDKIKFGTDGWRGVIAEDFTFANVRRVAAAIAAVRARRERTRARHDRRLRHAIPLRGICPSGRGGPCRCRIPVWLAKAGTPTPAVSYAVVARKAAGAVMITASHNPYRWNGIKFKAPYGGSAEPGDYPPHRRRISIASIARAPSRASHVPAAVEMVDLTTPYLERLKQLVNLDQIRASGQRFVIDPMYGAGSGCMARLVHRGGDSFEEIHAEHNPIFPGLNPEPIEPHVEGLRRAVIEGGFDAGFATDGDADRIGAMDRTGEFIDSHKIFSILLKHLVEDLGYRGDVVKTFSTTQMIDKMAPSTV